MTCTDTINDEVPKRNDVHCRLRYMELTVSDVDAFIEYIPTNPALASALCIARDEMIDEGLEITADSLIDYTVARGKLKVR